MSDQQKLAGILLVAKNMFPDTILVVTMERDQLSITKKLWEKHRKAQWTDMRRKSGLLKRLLLSKPRRSICLCSIPMLVYNLWHCSIK
jgi:hypothetical protein